MHRNKSQKAPEAVDNRTKTQNVKADTLNHQNARPAPVAQQEELNEENERS